MSTNQQQQIDRIISVVMDKQKVRGVSFTLEAGHGETYHTGQPTLYGHWPYERHSVLAGRECRSYIAAWDSAEEAHACLAEVKKLCKENKLRVRLDDMLEGGTTHVPVEQIVSHLPVDDDY